MRSLDDGTQAQRSRGRRLPGSRWLAAAGLSAALLLLGACTDEGQQQVADALENVSTTGAPADPGGEDQPPPETEPAPAPEPTAPPTQPPAGEAQPPTTEGQPLEEQSGLSDSDWVLLILLAIAAIALISAAISAAGRHSASKSARRMAVATRLDDIVGSCRWIHDSGSMEVLLVQSPTQVQSAWVPVRTRMMDVESQISTLGANTDSDDLRASLHDLGRTVTALRSAEEAYVTAKGRAAGLEADELLQSSHQTVIDRRRDLQLAIEPVASDMSYR